MPNRSDIEALTAATAYLAPLTRFSVDLANKGPSWMPMAMRTAPLRLVAYLVALHAGSR